MYISMLEIDGFKSYGNRVLIDKFHTQFNAITGLNGTGKSNILDALCFVLGIHNLSQIRVSKLDELIYKQGQGGITKASVTVKFNNENHKAPLPPPYCDMKEIIITRQVAIGGRSRYLLNSHNARPKDISDIFQSIQLNVNNPHFLIMQGRVTKVINMKSAELLGLIEEASGTKIYEIKRAYAVKLMQKKNQKLDETCKILSEEIQPTLNRLKNEKEEYNRWTSNDDEIQLLSRYDTAYQYYMTTEMAEKGNANLEKLKNEKEASEKQIEELNRNCEQIQKKIDELQRDSNKNCVSALKAEKDELDKHLSRLCSDLKEKKKDITKEETKRKEMENDLNKFEEKIKETQDANKKDDAEFLNAKKDILNFKEKLQFNEQLLHNILTGCIDGGGVSVSLRENLKNRRSRMAQIEAELFGYQKHQSNLTQELGFLKKNSLKANSDFDVLSREMNETKEKVERIKLEHEKSKFDQDSMQTLKALRQSLFDEVERLQLKIEKVRMSISYFFIKFLIPNDLNPAKVFGQFFELVQIKYDKLQYATALQMLGMGKLDYIIVDNKETSKALFNYNEFAKKNRKVTILPLEECKIFKLINRNMLEKARNMVGCSSDDDSKIVSNLDILTYKNDFLKAVQYVYGSSLICTNEEIARKITYNSGLRCTTATLQGDIYMFGGTMQGGSTKSDSHLLLRYREYTELRGQLEENKIQLEKTEKGIKEKIEAEESYIMLSRQLQISSKHLSHLQERLKMTPLGSEKQKMETIENELEGINKKIELLKAENEDVKSEIIKLEKQIVDFEQNKGNKESELRTEIKTLKNSLKNAEKAHNKKAEGMQEVRILLENMKREMQKTEEEIQEKNNEIRKMQNGIQDIQNQIENQKIKLTEKKEELAEKLKACEASSGEIKKLIETQNSIKKEITHANVSHKKLVHQIQNLEKDSQKAKRLVESLEENHAWLISEKLKFNKPGSVFDFQNLRLDSVRRRLEELRREQSTLERRVNRKAVEMYERAESEYNDLCIKKEKVEKDKKKIHEVIKDLDYKKKINLENTWKKVNKYFGSIFSQLLNNAQAKLVPIHNAKNDNISNIDSHEDHKTHDFDDLEAEEKFADGLVIKVGFNNKYKSSLQELSGGQKSLIALSLILGILKCKPAPVYILDEIDAALDLSHTQNIGSMIKTEFPDSQFIVVSLKEGLFSHADVLFKTRFIDGVSTVERHALSDRQTEKKKNEKKKN